MVELHLWKRGLLGMLSRLMRYSVQGERVVRVFDGVCIAFLVGCCYSSQVVIVGKIA